MFIKYDVVIFPKCLQWTPHMSTMSFLVQNMIEVILVTTIWFSISSCTGPCYNSTCVYFSGLLTSPMNWRASAMKKIQCIRPSVCSLQGLPIHHGPVWLDCYTVLAGWQYVGLSMGCKTWPPIDWHHTLVIVSYKCRLELIKSVMD